MFITPLNKDKESLSKAYVHREYEATVQHTAYKK